MGSLAMHPKFRTALMVLVLLVALLWVPKLGGDYYAYLFVLVFINIMLAASLRPSLTCGQLNIGHSAFMAIGRLYLGIACQKTGLAV